MNKQTDTKKYIIGILILSMFISTHAFAEDHDEYENENHRYEQRENHREDNDNDDDYYGKEKHQYGKEENDDEFEMKEKHQYGKKEMENDNDYKKEKREEKHEMKFKKEESDDDKFEMKEKHQYNREEVENHTVDFSEYEISELTDAEIAAIIHMREEEKMARDVYRTLSQTTNSKAFVNIPTSEGRHMDVFAQLIDRYDLTDPIVDESAIGVYADSSFTTLYNELVAKGQQSDKDAFEVGAMIEDINMSNLMNYGAATDKEDLKLAYSTLLGQSKHHMSSFIRNLDKLGYEYTPEHISETDLDEAVESGKKHMQKEAQEGGEKAQEMEREIEERTKKETKSFISAITEAISSLFSSWFK